MIEIRRESWSVVSQDEASILELFECCYCYGDPWIDWDNDKIMPVEDDWHERQEPVVYGRVSNWVGHDGRVRFDTWYRNERRQWPARNTAKIIQRQLDNPIDASGVPGVPVRHHLCGPLGWLPYGLSPDHYIDTFTSYRERRQYRSRRYVAKRFDKRSLERHRQSRRARERARWDGI